MDQQLTVHDQHSSCYGLCSEGLPLGVHVLLPFPADGWYEVAVAGESGLLFASRIVSCLCVRRTVLRFDAQARPKITPQIYSLQVRTCSQVLTVCVE